MTIFEMLLRVGTGVGLGAVIGVERQFRARMAGLRTNALVAVGATLFVLLSAHGFGGVPERRAPTRRGSPRRSCPASGSSAPASSCVTA